MKRSFLFILLSLTTVSVLAPTRHCDAVPAGVQRHVPAQSETAGAPEGSTAGAADHGTDDHAAAAGDHGPNPIPGPAAGLITSLTTLLVFLGLVVILGKYAWSPIVAGLKAREDKIRNDIETAERVRSQADDARRQYEQQLETAEGRVRDLMAQAQADGQQLATRIRMQAQEEAEEIKERAMREIDQGRREALEQIRAEAAGLATGIAEKILRREVNRDDQRRMIEDSLGELETVGSNA